ncbi:DUF4177 domain-containing protein [Fulvimarina endophytica]|uniref:DUF4177 domain-containing protein n=1 Tax=Fulvimarina endophytica TaxID=2293836 RepID=A0A371WY34_9HYPH|nr:DUF4177 domain-containing protein [Fulvimarina endophytica]
MPKFEYRVETMKAEKSAKSVTETLNALGADGWELVSVEEPYSTHLLMLFFKRPCAMAR